MTTRTLDRMNFYAPAQLGKTRRLTPEGYLLCEGVAIARTGSQVYGGHEIPLEPNADGTVIVSRPPEEVFREETIASFEGKSVTVEHPEDFVSPENWSQVSVGVVQNVRRGTGIEDDLLLADLLITAAGAITYANSDMPELSCGYAADYEQTEPGRAIQRNMIGNHVALVARGRAGPRCSIRDHGVPAMKISFADRLKRFVDAFISKDESAMKAALETTDDDPMASFDARMKKIEDWIEKSEARDAAREKEAKDARDAAAAGRTDLGRTYTGDELREIFGRAEMLSPGIHVPTGDSAAQVAGAPALMIKALEGALSTDGIKDAIAPLLVGREVKALTGDALLSVFNGAAEIARARNNKTVARIPATTRDFGKAPPTPAEINAANRAFWAGQK